MVLTYSSLSKSRIFDVCFSQLPQSSISSIRKPPPGAMKSVNFRPSKLAPVCRKSMVANVLLCDKSFNSLSISQTCGNFRSRWEETGNFTMLQKGAHIAFSN